MQLFSGFRTCNSYILPGRGACIIAFVLALASLPLIKTSAATQPAIFGVSGTVANALPLVITGAGFGSKSTARPLVFEDFSASLNPSLTNHGPVTLSNADNLRHPFSTRNGRADFKKMPLGGDGYYFDYNGGTAANWFVQYWIKLAPNWRFGAAPYPGPDDGLANVKIFRMFPTGERNYSNVGYAVHGWENGSLSRFVEFGAAPYVADSRPWFTPGAWHNVQVQYGENGGVDQTNGVIKLWVDGTLRDSTTTLNTNVGRDGPAVNKRPYIIGFFDSWPASDAAVTNMYAYYSDIYVDNSWARVELGNAATYGACTLREIQMPTAWSDGSVTVQVKQGAFTLGQVAYLYVTDASGNVSGGLRVSIGGGPAPPTNVKILR
jgi:hypothetical protein